MIRAQAGRVEFDEQQLRRNVEDVINRRVFAVLSAVREEIVTYLQSYIDEVRPPELKTKYFGGNPESPRPAHPGHWADISGNLKAGYHAEVEQDDDGHWQLRIWNDALDNKGNYIAPFVEARTGYFVVSGIMDDDGPVQHAIREAFQRYNGDVSVTIHEGQLLVGYQA